MNATRLDALRHTLRSRRLDAVIITHLPHIRWLTGFTGSNAVILVTPRDQFLLTDGRYKTQAPDEVKGFSIFVTGNSLFALMAERRLVRHCKRVAIQAGFVPLTMYRNLRTLFPKTTFAETSGLIEPLMAVKEEFEIVFIRAAVAITDSVFAKIVPMLRPGVRELEIAAEITYQHRMLGADGDAFDPIVASGERGALPHAHASERAIRRGEMVTLDFGCRVQGYCSDLTRTVAVGKPGAEMKKIYETVLEAQNLAIGRAADGVSARLLDRIARRHIREQGYGRYFNHSLGHGVGLEIHEPLRLSRISKDILATGHVVTVEPGVYVPRLGGVRIEDDIVIRGPGCEILNRSPKNLIVV